LPVQISHLPVVAAVMTAVTVMIAVQKSPLSFQRSLSQLLIMVQNRLSMIAAAPTVAQMRMK